MSNFVCTRHKQFFSADAHRDCPICEVEGVTSFSSQKQLRAIANEPPITIISIEECDLPSFDGVNVTDAFDFNLPPFGGLSPPANSKLRDLFASKAPWDK
jgi:hypothetical protein